MLAEQITALSALLWSGGAALYLVASWALVQVAWKGVQKYHERKAHEAQQQGS